MLGDMASGRWWSSYVADSILVMLQQFRYRQNIDTDITHETKAEIDLESASDSDQQRQQQKHRTVATAQSQ